MPRALNAEERRLLSLATSQLAEIADASVAGAWHVITEALANGWLSPSGRLSLQSLITELAGGGGVSVEEYAIEASQEAGGGDTVIVSFLADRFYVPRAEMLFELRRLQARLRGEAEPATPPRAAAKAEAEPASRPADVAASPDSSAAPDAEADAADAEASDDAAPTPPLRVAPSPLSLVPPLPREEEASDSADAAFADSDSDAADSSAPSTPSRELGRVIDAFAEKLRSGAADKPGSFLAHIREAMERARAETQQKAAAAAAASRAAPDDELSASSAEAKASVEKLLQSARDIDRGQLAEALHHAAEWVKSPERGGAAIDSLLKRLEGRLNEAFAKKDGEPDRVSQALQNARDAMARRIADAAAVRAREASAAGSEAAKAAKIDKPDKPKLTAVTDDDEKN